MELIDFSTNQIIYRFTNGDFLFVNTRLKETELYQLETPRDREITARATFNLFKEIGD